MVLGETLKRCIKTKTAWKKNNVGIKNTSKICLNYSSFGLKMASHSKVKFLIRVQAYAYTSLELFRQVWMGVKRAIFCSQQGEDVRLRGMFVAYS